MRRPDLGNLLASGEHLLENAHQGAILKGSGDPFFVSQLLVDLFVCGVRALLDADIDAKARGQGLLQADAHAQANDGSQRAVGDGRGDLNDDGADGGQWRGRGQDVDVGQVDDGE